MSRLVIAIAVAAALAVPAVAQAGGWATVKLAPPPAGLEAEETWTAQLTVLRHGVTPTDGADTVDHDSGESGPQTFRAKPAGTTGNYVAHVVFPSGGRWDYEVNDGLAATGYGGSQTHTYSPVVIAPGAGGGDSGIPVWPFALGALLALVLGFAVVTRQRQRRPAPAS